MGYIDEIVCWDMRALRTSRMKNVIHESAGIGEREGVENLAILIKGSGEDYARRVQEFLEVAREEKRRKEKEENDKTKWNVSARVFSPEKGKEETEKSEGREEGELMELYPQGGLMVIHSDKSSDKDPESSAERILLSQHELFEDILEEIAPVRITMDAVTLQRVRDGMARDEQRNRELEVSLRIALQTLQRLEARVQAAERRTKKTSPE